MSSARTKKIISPRITPPVAGKVGTMAFTGLGEVVSDDGSVAGTVVAGGSVVVTGGSVVVVGGSVVVVGGIVVDGGGDQVTEVETVFETPFTVAVAV